MRGFITLSGVAATLSGVRDDVDLNKEVRSLFFALSVVNNALHDGVVHVSPILIFLINPLEPHYLLPVPQPRH